MSGVDWSRVREVFERALDAPPAQRRSVVQEACAGDEALRAEVESLLRADAVATGFMDRPLVESAADSGSHTGRRFGPYELDEQIGIGGMGVVYRAHRADGAYEQEVVVKLLRGHALDGELHWRFERERQVLASLRHPNIARLLDGGVGEGGQPFLVMEFVRGEDILTHCSRRALGLAERLELFDAVCAGVQHAHRNLVVHRDLKPAHAVIDEDGQPKLLDFGIATILRDETSDRFATLTAENRLTPQYASPEQVRGEAVTTATDVYALGLILYELLAGEPPYRVQSGTTDADRRLICETAPVPPSRSVKDPRLARRLKGDLDTVVLAAIRKEPSRRYASAEALREDLRRYRQHLPIHARPDTVAYRCAKFVTRNRLPVAAGLAASLALLGATIGVGWQAGVANERRREAETALKTSDTVGQFLRSILVAADPREAGQDVTMRDALDRASARIDAELAEEPAVEARVREAIGMTYRTLGSLEQAESHLARAHEIAPGALKDPLELARISHELALLRLDQGRFDDADGLVRESMETRVRLIGPDAPDSLMSRNVLALVCLRRAAYDEALGHASAVVEARERTLGPDHADTLEARNTVAEILMDTEREEAALEILMSVYEAQARTIGEDHPDTHITVNDIATCHSRLGRPEIAIEWYRRALAGLEARFPAGSIDVVIPRTNIARVHLRLDQPVEARELAERALADGTNALGESHYAVAFARLTLGLALAALGEPGAARPLLERARDDLAEAFGPGDRLVVEAAEALAALTEN